MADAEIEIKATADAAEAQQQLERTAAAIERVAVAVQDAAERLRTFDLSPLSEALASFESSAARTKSLSGAVSGWRDEVEGAKASAEATVDAIGDLSLRLEDVAQGLRDGSMSSEQAIAATQKIRDEYKALSTESQEFRQAVRELYGDLQSASAVAAAAAEKEGQAAEKSLQKIAQRGGSCPQLRQHAGCCGCGAAGRCRRTGPATAQCGRAARRGSGGADSVSSPNPPLAGGQELCRAGAPSQGAGGGSRGGGSGRGRGGL